MGKIILVRHGAIDEAYDNKYVGAQDVALSQIGHQQAATIGKYLKNIGQIDRIFCSPMLRVRQTHDGALAILDPEGLPETVYMDELREIDFGQWSGLTLEEIMERFPQYHKLFLRLDDDFSFPHGDSLRDFQQRVRKFYQILCAESKIHETIVVFAHGGVIAQLIGCLLDLTKANIWSIRVNRGAVATFEIDQNNFAVLTELGLNN